MALGMKRVLFAVLLLVLSPFILPSNAQQPAAPIKVNQITGLAGVANKTKGSITVENGNLRFAHGKTNVDLAATSMQDVVTGTVSKRLVKGIWGMFPEVVPYGTGRFTSM